MLLSLMRFTDIREALYYSRILGYAIIDLDELEGANR